MHTHMLLSLRTRGNERMKWVKTGEGNVSWMSSGQTAGLNRRREASVGGQGVGTQRLGLHVSAPQS